MRKGFKFMKRKLLIATTLLLSLSLTACTSSSTRSNSVKTSRVTKQTANAIKAEETNEIVLTDGRILLPENYRYAVMESEDGDLTTYFVFNPDKSNEIADKRDGRSEGEYEKSVEEAWRIAKEEAEEKANSGINKLINSFKGEEEEETTEEDVFVFDTTAYTTAYNENTFLYIYEGVDRLSPQEHLDDSMIKSSLTTYITNTIGSNIEMTSRMIDTFAMPRSIWKTVNNLPEKKTEIDIPETDKWQFVETMNDKYYVTTFTAYSGDHLASTYGSYCYPHSYYGIFLVEKEASHGSIRKYYGFVFGNVADGTYFSKEEYNDIFKQIKSQFKLTQFFTLYQKDDYAYEKATDFSKGKSYSQFEDFYALTREYYIMHENKSIDIDSLTDEEVEAGDSITVIDFTEEVGGE